MQPPVLQERSLHSDGSTPLDTYRGLMVGCWKHTDRLQDHRAAIGKPTLSVTLSFTRMHNRPPIVHCADGKALLEYRGLVSTCPPINISRPWMVAVYNPPQCPGSPPAW